MPTDSNQGDLSAEELAYQQAVKYGQDLARLYTAERARSAELEAAQRELESRVEERTAALVDANLRLKKEMHDRQQAEEAERRRVQELAIIEERHRIARDLHDAVSQTLWSAGLLADTLPDMWELDPAEGREMVHELKGLIRGALAEMRTLLLELRPEQLAAKPLDVLLRQLGDSAVSRTGLHVLIETSGECELPPNAQVSLYRIAQESLNNAIKHAQATCVTLRLEQSEEQVWLTIRDDGQGFDPTDIPPGHMGIGIMRERAAGIGASFDVYSRIGDSTQIEVIWPAPANRKAAS